MQRLKVSQLSIENKPYSLLPIPSKVFLNSCRFAFVLDFIRSANKSVRYLLRSSSFFIPSESGMEGRQQEKTKKRVSLVRDDEV